MKTKDKSEVQSVILTKPTLTTTERRRQEGVGVVVRGCFSAAALAFLCAVAISGCGRPPGGMPGMPGGPGGPMGAMQPEVSTVTVTQQSVMLTTDLPGRTAPYLIAEIRPQVSGLIQKRLFKEGADVKAGDVLYQIDPAPFQAALELAEANLAAAKKAADRARAALNASIANVAKQQATLAFARTNRQRFEELFKDRAVSARDSDLAATDAAVAEAGMKAVEAQVQSDRESVAAAEAAIQQAAAALETARINLGYTKITAPISGRIGKSSVTDGAIVTAYQPMPLAVIQQLDPIYVDVPQSTAELLRLQRRLAEGRIAQSGTNLNFVRLLLEDGTEYPLEGTLQFRDVTVDPTTGSVILRMVFPNPKGVLLPGMFVRASIKEGVSERAILIPQQSVTRDSKGNPMALVVGPNNILQPRPLILERAIGDKWLVTAGLAPGDKIVVEGFQRVRPGMPVKEVPFGTSTMQKMPAGAGAPAGQMPPSMPKSK